MLQKFFLINEIKFKVIKKNLIFFYMFLKIIFMYDYLLFFAEK